MIVIKEIEPSRADAIRLTRNEKMAMILLAHSASVLEDLRTDISNRLGMVEKDVPVIFDYDNQFIPTEKYDATYSYKKANGYFPGIAQLNLHPFYIENRDGNASVKFEQAETLERAFAKLRTNGIKVDKARMDCGSYSQEVVEVASCNSNTFYIRAMSCQTLENRIAEIKEDEWQNTSSPQ